LTPSSHDSLKGTNFHANFTVYSLTGYRLQYSFDLQPLYNECVSSPCLNGASCVDTPAYFYCECVSGFSGFNCSVRKLQIDGLRGIPGAFGFITIIPCL